MFCTENPQISTGNMSTLQKKKKRFCLKISLVNVTKSAVNCGFGLIYSRNPL